MVRKPLLAQWLISEAIFLWIQSIIPDVSGISTPFGGLSQMRGQVTYALLTRAPLYLFPEGNVRVRLACVKHAASVRSEPGSNSPVYMLSLLINYHDQRYWFVDRLCCLFLTEPMCLKKTPWARLRMLLFSCQGSFVPARRIAAQR